MRRVVTGSAIILVCTLALGGLGWIGKLWYESRLPGTYSVLDYGTPDYGGPAAPSVVNGMSGHQGHSGGISVTDLRERRADTRPTAFTLEARHAQIRLASGKVVEALTFNGSSPGPELRVRQSELVQVTLVNEDVESGVTLHWHGVDVPNAEDGVAGVTQDAVLPGERYVYRFRAEQVGTFWYHTHQLSSKEVRRGLFGAFVIEPPQGSGRRLDLPLLAHIYDGVPTINGSDVLERRAVAQGTPARLRLVNTDNASHRFALTGTTFRVAAVDGTDLNRPALLENVSIDLPAGGRADLVFTMPSKPVRVSVDEWQVGLALSADGLASPAASVPLTTFDPATYGEPAAASFDSSSQFDRRFRLTIGKKPGFFAGRPGMQWTINGHIYPDTPVFHVDEGDLVEVTIANEGNGSHPMHLHGHHLLVMSRNGVAVSGSPWWVDTLGVGEGEEYVVGFRADNPGIWMDHCHNLRHAAQGLTMHVAYSGVTTPFEIGAEHHNRPE